MTRNLDPSPIEQLALCHQRAGEVTRGTELIEMRVVVEKTSRVHKALCSLFVWR